MKVTVSQIPLEGTEFEREFDVEVEEGCPAHASALFRLDIVAGQLLARGTIKAHATLECGRCLKPYGADFDIKFELPFKPEADEDEDESSLRGERELTSDELTSATYADDELDVDEMLREQLILGIPMRRLCGEGCKGICPRCGADLNEGDCGCPQSAADPRFQALEKLLKQDNSSKKKERK